MNTKDLHDELRRIEDVIAMRTDGSLEADFAIFKLRRLAESQRLLSRPGWTMEEKPRPGSEVLVTDGLFVWISGYEDGRFTVDDIRVTQWRYLV